MFYWKLAMDYNYDDIEINAHLCFSSPSTGRSRGCVADEDIRGFHSPHWRSPEAFSEFSCGYKQPQ